LSAYRSTPGKSLLAVEDSVTMRKVIEMTFAGEDLRVVTVASAQEALAACRRQAPDVVLADVSLEGQSGYDLCRAIKDEFKGIPVVILSSKQNPYDPARGQASGADASLDKPYDTAKAIEIVKKILEKGHSVAPAPIAAAPVAGPPQPPKPPMFAPPPMAPPPQPAAQAAVTRPQQPPPAAHSTVQGMPQSSAPAPRAGGLQSPALQSQGTRRIESIEVPQPPPSANPALRRQATPALQRQGTLKMTSDAPPGGQAQASSSSSQVQHGTLAELAQIPGGGNGGAQIGAELQSKLGALGLTPQQVEAVVALSREVVEKVVWEVVPVLAETLVKEEIARLTREG
jgi:CheY-like chemotaxis protein